MEWNEISVNPVIILTISSAIFLVLLILLVKTKNNSFKKRPPGPSGWPIIGNILEFGHELPHQTMHKLKTKYGPILWLQLGSINTMVIQSSSEAAELFKKHDVSFADRLTPHTLTAFNFHEHALSMTQYGQYWRVLRRLSTMELMSHKRLTEDTDLRRRIIRKMVRWIEEDSVASCAIHLNRYLFAMTYNIIGNLLFSRDLLDPNDDEATEFVKVVEEISEIAATPNIGDVFPFLKWMDFQGLKKKMNKCMSKMLEISSAYVQERIDKRKTGEFQGKNDYIDILFNYKGDVGDGKERFTMEQVNTIVLEMFLAGTDTTFISIEWGLAELLHSPHTFQKLREEIDRAVGFNRNVEESDMKNLPYLQAVIKETFRLHPPIPLLFPRKATEDTNYMGYHIPKSTQVLVNVWSIGRDPKVWDDPLTFKPERFLDSNIEYKGQHYDLIPFGSGRRICIGMSLAHRIVPLALATLVQAFDWELGNGIKPEDIEMDEDLGMTLSKKNSLRVIPKKRLHI